MKARAESDLGDFTDSSLFTEPLDEERVGDGARMLWVAMVCALAWALALIVVL